MPKFYLAADPHYDNVSMMKMVTFVMEHGMKMDANLKAMKALIASCMKLFPFGVESSKD